MKQHLVVSWDQKLLKTQFRTFYFDGRSTWRIENLPSDSHSASDGQALGFNFHDIFLPYDDIYHVNPIWWYISCISNMMISIIYIPFDDIYRAYISHISIYPSRQISPIWCQRACRHILMVPSLDGGFFMVLFNIILQIILFITLSQLFCLYLNRISLLFALAFFATSLLSNSFWKNNFSCQGFPPVPFWCLPKSFCFW